MKWCDWKGHDCEEVKEVPIEFSKGFVIYYNFCLKCYETEKYKQNGPEQITFDI